MKKSRPLPFSWVHAWREFSDLDHGVRSVLSMLSQYMDKRGVAWPSYATLARDTGYTVRHVKRLIKTARTRGWLVIETGGGPPGRGGHPNKYSAAFPSGDILDQSGDTGDIEVVTPVSPKESGRTQERILTGDLSAYESGLPTRTELVEAIDAGAATLVATAGVKDFTRPEADWLLTGLHRAEGVILTAEEDTAGLVAIVLADLRRKGRTWGRQRFRTFMEAAIRIRSVEDAGDDDAAYVTVAWADPQEPRTGESPRRPDPSKWIVKR